MQLTCTMLTPLCCVTRKHCCLELLLLCFQILINEEHKAKRKQVRQLA